MPQKSFPEFKIIPLGIGAVTLEFGANVSTELNEKAIRAARQIESNPFPGFIEAVPAYASVTVFFDVTDVRRVRPFDETAFAAVAAIVSEILERRSETTAVRERVIEIAATFGGDDGPDLDFVADRAGLSISATLEIFLSRTYRVYMLGFLPGFAYLGEVDERIATPRKPTPRLHVPAGSIGIAGVQTGIYPLDSPGGWQLIGRTAVKMFDAESDPPCILRPGDRVRFRSL